MKALDHIRILDFTHMVSGPYATLLLGDSGAEIIKIEPPGTGEGTRRLLENDPLYSVEGMGAYFLTLGRNKKSITLDTRTDEGRAVFERLVAVSDVVVYNYRAGIGAKRGFTYDALKAINPRIISCSLTGFGETGPHRDRAAFDLVAQGSGGSMFISRGDEPLRAGVPIGDLGGGLMATIGILTALQARVRTGRGQQLDISMQDAQISLLNYMATTYFLAGKEPPPIGNSHFAFVPYGTFKARDGYIIIAVITNHFWQDLIHALDMPELAIPAYADHAGRVANREKITAALEAKLALKDGEEWIKIMSAHGIPCGPVHGIADAMNDPQVIARNMVVEVQHPNGKRCKQVGNPIKMSETYEDSFSPPPLLGQHNDEILQKLLGMKAADVAALKSKGII